MASSSATIPREYRKRPGTSGIRGQLYETKLLSLIYFRAIHDDRIEEFHLATNVDKIGSFDDICFRAKVRGIDKPLSVFIQAKHKENNNSVLTLNNSDLVEYFNSYFEIRRKFKPDNKDVLFDGTFDETECLFVVYTTAKGEQNTRAYDSNTYTSNFAEPLNALIRTGDPDSWPSLVLDLKKLCKVVLEEQITALARTMAKCIFGEIKDIQMLMQNEVVLRFHVILGQKVFYVSEKKPEGHRVARFRDDFCDADDEYLRLFKNSLILELKKRDSISVDTVEVKLMKEFKVPASFGNKDLTIRGGDDKIERKLKDLTSRIVELIEQSKPSNIVTIDESLGKGFLQLSGGIASAVGNLLVFDDESNLMKFNENHELLGKLAKNLYRKLKERVHNLNEFKFDVKAKIFPKLSFATDEYNKKVVSDLLSTLLFYASQHNEKKVEETLIYEIMNTLGDDVDNVEAISDAIFLKYHDEIQKWSLPRLGIGTYLEKQGTLYKNAVKHATRQPLISVINMMQRIKNKSYTFKKDVVNSIKYDDLPSGTVIVTDNRALTVVKLTNCLNYKDCIVLDLEYILNLSARDDKTLHRELTDTNEVKTVIVVFDQALIVENSSKKLEKIATSIKDKIVIIVTDQKTAENAKKYFSPTGNVIQDEIKLIDLSEESQHSIIKNTKVIFQGKEVRLIRILIQDTFEYVEGEVLYKMMHSNKNIIGKPISNSNYNTKLFVNSSLRCIELKTPKNLKGFYRPPKKEGLLLHSYRRATLARRKTGKIYKFTSLHELLEDDVVLIIGDPGMGKSTLLTHLSFETLKIWLKPEWILRINLLEYSKQFSEWKTKKTVIDTLESLKFLCKVALSKESSQTNNNLNITLEESNGAVYLKDCTGDAWTVFELKMFLSFYSNQELIILLDGFDEICPTYANEVLALIKAVKKFPRTHKMCITSRSYGKMNTILALQCFIIYEIKPLDTSQQDLYLNSFWEENKILKDLNDDHLKNIYEFITFMSKSVNLRELKKKSDLPIESKTEIPFLTVFLSLIKYLKQNLTLAPSSFMNALKKLYEECYGLFQNQSFAVPLHLNIIAGYLYKKIKEINIKPINWDLNTNIFNIYEDFIVTKLKRIRFQEKNQIDMSKPDNITAYEREYEDFKVKHKKLAAYAVFNKCLFDENESKEIEEMIYKLKEGEERTGIICDVVDDTPIFVHSTFAEYFAVEYICDLLKSDENQKALWDFMLNAMFFNCNLNVLTTLDAKIKIDNEMPELFEKNKKLIFDLLLKQGKNTENLHDEIRSSLCEAIRSDLRTIGSLLLSTIGDNLDESNLMNFIKIVKETNMLLIAVKMEFEEFIASIVNHVKVIDESKLILLFEDFELNENVQNVSTDELVHKLHRYVWKRMNIVPDWEHLAELIDQIYFI